MSKMQVEEIELLKEAVFIPEKNRVKVISSIKILNND